MGEEIDLLRNYPRTKRNVKERGASKTEKDREIARRFGREFFDGDRAHGYGGFTYHPRFWQPVIPDFVDRYGLGPGHTVLDVGCAKGFMLHDFVELVPGIHVRGIDVSEYAIENGMEDVKPYLRVADARRLPFDDDSFDLVISINTVHNLEVDDCAQALREIMRVGKGHAFIKVDAYHDKEERERMEAWDLTARTIMHVEEWKALFQRVGYTGDYYWFIP